MIKHTDIRNKFLITLCGSCYKIIESTGRKGLLMGAVEEFISFITIAYSFALAIIVDMVLIESRYCRWIYWMSCLAYIAIFCFIFLVLCQNYDVEMTKKYILFVDITARAVFFFIMAKYRRSRFLFTYCTAEVVYMAAVSFSAIMGMVINEGIFKNLNIRVMLVTIITFFILIFIIKPYRCIMAFFKEKWNIVAAISILLCGLLYGYFFYPTPIVLRPQAMPLGIIILALMFAVYSFIYKVFSYLGKIETNEQGLRLQISVQKEQLSTVLDKIRSEQIFHHDLRHHANLIAKMIADKNDEEAFVYTRKLGSYVLNAASINYCENSLVNAILSVHSEEAKKKNITLNCKAVLPKNINIDEMEICVLLSNLLENAVMHCKSLEENKSAMVDISILQNKDQLCIKIQNSYSMEFRQEEKNVSLAKRLMDGIGLQSVRTIVERKQGVMDITYNENTFTVFVGLKI